MWCKQGAKGVAAVRREYAIDRLDYYNVVMNLPAFALSALSLWSFALSGTTVEEHSNADIDRRSERAALLFEQGDPAESKRIYESLFSTLRDRPASAQLGFTLNGLSKIAAAEGDYRGAVQLAQQSAAAYQKVGDVSGEAPRSAILARWGHSR